MKPVIIYNMSVTVSDGELSDTKHLEVSVLDVNEAPYFVHSVYYLTGNEGPVSIPSLNYK